MAMEYLQPHYRNTASGWDESWWPCAELMSHGIVIDSLVIIAPSNVRCILIQRWAHLQMRAGCDRLVELGPSLVGQDVFHWAPRYVDVSQRAMNGAIIGRQERVCLEHLVLIWLKDWIDVDLTREAVINVSQRRSLKSTHISTLKMTMDGAD